MDKINKVNQNRKSKSQAFNVMAFPVGPVCNLRCEYCYYLDKKELYPDTDNFNMSEELLEEYIKQYIESQPGPQISFGWQGGEPTLRGLDFYKKAVKYIEKHLPENWKYEITFQTNAVLIDEEWAQFMAENNFLVGVSIDGPAELHDVYRKDKQGHPTHEKVMEGLKKLQQHGVQYNILCVVNAANAPYPAKVYNFFKELGAEHIQFIPIVEQKNGEVSSRSVGPVEYGEFLIGVFDEWIFDGYGEIYVQIFEQCVSAWYGYEPSLCVFRETCGQAPVLEHNGDLYACDHFVFPEDKLGNIKEAPIQELMNSPQQQKFGEDKRDQLPSTCRNCDYLFICHGGCPKNRIDKAGDGQKINYLCQGYKRFFDYIDPYLQEIVDKIQQRQPPPVVQKHLQELHDSIWDVGRNEPCPCGSGKKYKKCCIDRK